MIGWHISVYRQKDGGDLPAMDESATGARLAGWHARDGGLDWLDELAKAGKAIDLGGNGYPRKFTAPAEDLVPRILSTPPHALDPWGRECDPDLCFWVGKNLIDATVRRQIRFDEWLIVSVLDESFDENEE